MSFGSLSAFVIIHSYLLGRVFAPRNSFLHLDLWLYLTSTFCWSEVKRCNRLFDIPRAPFESSTANDFTLFASTRTFEFNTFVWNPSCLILEKAFSKFPISQRLVLGWISIDNGRLLRYRSLYYSHYSRGSYHPQYNLGWASSAIYYPLLPAQTSWSFLWSTFRFTFAYSIFHIFSRTRHCTFCLFLA